VYGHSGASGFGGYGPKAAEVTSSRSVHVVAGYITSERVARTQKLSHVTADDSAAPQTFLIDAE
jgi:hypothetical protein